MGSQGVPARAGGWDKAMGRWWRKFGEDLSSPLEIGVGKGSCGRCSVAGLGVRLGDLVWRSRRRGGALQLVFLPPYQEWSALVSRFFITCSSTIIAYRILYCVFIVDLLCFSFICKVATIELL